MLCRRDKELYRQKHTGWSRLRGSMDAMCTELGARGGAEIPWVISRRGRDIITSPVGLADGRFLKEMMILLV